MQYNEYIKSEEWQVKRQKKLSKKPYCQICRTDDNLHIHHKHYKTFESEKNTDLMTLCSSCHAYLHKHIGHSVKKTNKKICRVRRLLELGVNKRMAFYIVGHNGLWAELYSEIKIYAGERTTHPVGIQANNTAR